jgi:hypothetical protein
MHIPLKWGVGGLAYGGRKAITAILAARSASAIQLAQLAA